MAQPQARTRSYTREVVERMHTIHDGFIQAFAHFAIFYPNFRGFVPKNNCNTPKGGARGAAPAETLSNVTPR